MGEEFDTHWEYWQPDPDIEWAMAHNCRGVCVLDLLNSTMPRKGGNTGMRWGHGNPDAVSSFRLARARPENDTRRPPLAARPCVVCGVAFVPSRSSRRFCGRRCAHRQLMEADCAGCGQKFRPWRSGQRFCSPACAAPLGAPQSSVDLDRLQVMYKTGVAVAVIAAALGVQVAQVKRLRQRLGLAARPSGRPKQEAKGQTLGVSPPRVCSINDHA